MYSPMENWLSWSRELREYRSAPQPPSQPPGLVRFPMYGTHDLPAEPINDDCEIHMAALHFDVGDVNEPGLI